MIHVKRSGILWYFVLFVTYCFGQELPVIHRINDNPSKSAITCIFEDDHGFIWYGTRHGLYRYDGLNFEKFIHEIADRSSISGNRIEDAIKDQNNNIWITGDGLGFLIPRPVFLVPFTLMRKPALESIATSQQPFLKMSMD